MAFRFKFEMVLRLRRSLERQQELLLQAANHEILQTQQQIRNLERWRASLEQNETQSLTAGTAAAELLFDDGLRAAIAQQKQQFHKQLLCLERVRDQRRTAIEEARRQREIIENLKNQKLGAYRVDQTRKDQRAMDDLFLMRRSSQQTVGKHLKRV